MRRKGEIEVEAAMRRWKWQLLIEKFPPVGLKKGEIEGQSATKS